MILVKLNYYFSSIPGALDEEVEEAENFFLNENHTKPTSNPPDLIMPDRERRPDEPLPPLNQVRYFSFFLIIQYILICSFLASDSIY